MIARTCNKFVLLPRLCFRTDAFLSRAKGRACGRWTSRQSPAELGLAPFELAPVRDCLPAAESFSLRKLWGSEGKAPSRYLQASFAHGPDQSHLHCPPNLEVKSTAVTSSFTKLFDSATVSYHAVKPWLHHFCHSNVLTSTNASLPRGKVETRSRTFSTAASSDSSKRDTKEESEHWLQTILPSQVWPFVQLARLDKPVGTWLLAWPCFWSIALAAEAGSLPDARMLALFGTGSILLRGAGCTINDLIDRDIDAQVERTRTRPLASGALSPRAAVAFLGAQLTLGLGILVQLNDLSRVLGVSSLLLVATYPLMKRVTFWPQAFLGLTFNWGAIMGWAATTGYVAPSVVAPLYLAGVSWTLLYDTIYAHQDAVDDRRVGVKSSALALGDRGTRPWLGIFGAATVAGIGVAGTAAGAAGVPFFVGLGAGAAQLAWQAATVNVHDRHDCHRKFVSNKWFGAIIFGAIVAGRWSATQDRRERDDGQES